MTSTEQANLESPRSWLLSVLSTRRLLALCKRADGKRLEHKGHLVRVVLGAGA